MTYSNEQRALEVAASLNRNPGYPPAYAVLTTNGWTVVRTYGNPAKWGEVTRKA